MATGEHEAGITVRLDIHQDKYLPARAHGREMHAIVTVRVEGAAGGGGAPALAEVLVIDCSSSMSEPPEKFRAAKSAAAAALGKLPDGAPFAVVQGTDGADMAFPPDPAMPPANAALRAAAEHAVFGLHAAGGTAISTWLDLSRELLAGQRAPIRHVLLLTDGRNVHDDRRPLAAVLDACEGRFVCDAWGIGTGWDARELQLITGRLHGGVGAVREESELVAAYRSLMDRLITKSVPELVVSVTPSPGSTVRYLHQVYPTRTELAGTAAGADGRTAAFTTMAWGAEERRYHLCLSADPAGRPRGEDTQIAAIEVSLPDTGAGTRGGRGHAGDRGQGAHAAAGAGGAGGGRRGGAGGSGGPPSAAVHLPLPLPCVVHWTDDPVPAEPGGHSHVAHFLDYQRLGQAAARADDAFRRGEGRAAERHLGEAARLVRRLGDRRVLDQLERLVEIDAAADRVTLRPGVDPVEFQHLITASSHSTFGPGAQEWTQPWDAPPAPAIRHPSAPRHPASSRPRHPASGRPGVRR